MKSPQHLLIVVGARPQFIKAAALNRALATSSNWKSSWIHTGQHHDHALSSRFFEELDLPTPEVTLTPNAESRELRLGDMMHGIRARIQEDRPDWLLVFGDTDSTLAGAWAAAAERVPLVHVEAGLRSHQWSMPEEVNRVLTDRLSSVLVCPTDVAVDHLKAEGIVHACPVDALPNATMPVVLRTGDVMHDNALHFGTSWPVESRGRGQVLLTMHRPSNVDDPKRLRTWLESISHWLQSEGRRAVFPVHPRTQKSLDASWTNWREHAAGMGMDCVDPMGYLELLRAVCDAPLVLTDSGGVQKEAFSLGTRCVVLRPTTEWVEQVTLGHSTLVADPAELPDAAHTALHQGRFHPSDLYGSGHSAMDILRCLEERMEPSRTRSPR